MILTFKFRLSFFGFVFFFIFNLIFGGFFQTAFFGGCPEHPPEFWPDEKVLKMVEVKISSIK